MLKSTAPWSCTKVNVFTGSPRLPKTGDMDDCDTIYTHGAVETFMVDRIKAPLMKGIASTNSIGGLLKSPEFKESFSQIRRLPKPTLQNTRWCNTVILLKARDAAVSLKLLPLPNFIAVPVADFTVAVYDYDPYYQQRLDWLYERLKALGWNSDWRINRATLEKVKAEFFALENNPGREKAFLFIWNAAINLYATRKGRRFLDWLIPFLLNSNWEAREPGYPRPPCWREFQNLY